MRLTHGGAYVALLAIAVSIPRIALSNEDATSAQASKTVAWMSDYFQAYSEAKESGKLLLVYFANPNVTTAAQQFEQTTLKNDEVRRLSEKYVLVKVTTTTTIEDNGQTIRLLDHGAFSHMNGREGLAVVDLKNQNRSHYGKPVGCLPFESGVYYAPNFWSTESVQAFLGLPEGTLTQRMLTFAVRLHPERPASTHSRSDERLMIACESHSQHQASIQSQGHHNWETRFQEIYQTVGGQAPVEVCAESWPGENLLHSCFSCVYAWRQSPGHWGAVNARQPAFGYDIKQGANGIWYATGIFGGSWPLEG